MPSRLHPILSALGESEPSAMEIAEILWLALRTGPTTDPAAPSQEGPTDALPDPGRPSNVQPREPVAPAPEPDTEPRPGFDHDEPAPQGDQRVGLHTEAGADHSIGGTYQPLLVPAPDALGGRLALQRAIRPLKRRVPSRQSVRLDEEKTVEGIADSLVRAAPRGTASMWESVLRPTEERWLELAIVADRSRGMAMWQPHAAELYELMKETGAFSDVRLWHFQTVGNKCVLAPANSRGDFRSPSVLGGSSARRAILVVSDCTDAAWWRGGAMKMLHGWARVHPVGLVQPLPERLWHRTAAPAIPGRIVSPRPGCPNANLRFVPFEDFSDIAADGLILPVMELAAPWLHGWASAVAGLAAPDSPMAAAYLQVISPALDQQEESSVSARDRVLRFRSSASPEAFRLAGYLATSVLTLPVMRLVQRVMLGSQTGPSHLAEVILGGLMRARGDDTYEFYDGVLELLLKTLPASDALNTIQVLQRVSADIEARAGTGGGFPAVVPVPTGETSAAGQEFALVSPEAIATLLPRARTQPRSVAPADFLDRASRQRAVDREPIQPSPYAATTGRSRIYQPMLFVGLGGAGCRIGVELEQRLRAEMCGPDGTKLLSVIDRPDLLPYELPSCLQFVYADFNAATLEQVRRDVVPSRKHDPAAQKTMHLTADLLPAGLDSSPEIARSLRLNVDEQTIDWLPGPDNMPMVGPLYRGAGQLPTVARSILFETLRRNPDIALRGVKDAIAAINTSAGDLYVMSGRRTQRVDPVAVVVAFSVAGGTGAGIFYDYLHLIGDLMQIGGRQAEIFPLVLMPSAFDEGTGGGRPAELNAGSALIDLFRLVDDQNAWDERGVEVTYPNFEQVRLRPATTQTAFLFSRTGGSSRDDVGRSMAAFVHSLIGSAPTDEDPYEARMTQSFADSFVNSAVNRYAVAETGIGRRGATTAAVAELITPLPELIHIISSHLLAMAINELAVANPAGEQNDVLWREFATAAGLKRLHDGTPIDPVDSPTATGQVIDALRYRAGKMSALIEGAPFVLQEIVGPLARDFDPSAGAVALLRDIDLFRLDRALFGIHGYGVDRIGFQSLLEGWRSEPPAPGGIRFGEPVPMLPDGPVRRFRRLRMTDEPVQAVIRQQDAWYTWQSRRVWNAAWNDNYPIWGRRWRVFAKEFRAIHEQLVLHARDDARLFDLRSKNLYRMRAGVSYLLPPEDQGLEGFYEAVLSRLRPESGTREGHIVNQLLGPDGWAKAYVRGRDDPVAAVSYVLQRISEFVSDVLRPADRSRPALVPRMEDLLANAVRRGDDNIGEGDLNRFRSKLAAIVPGGFAPEGRAPLRALITYPAVQDDPEIEAFLRHETGLTADFFQPEFRAVQADALSVVMTRTSMSVTEVPEARNVIKRWADAVRDPRPADIVNWRRRLTPDPGYVLIDAEDRQRILHRLLCDAWNGDLTVTGRLESPEETVLLPLGSRDSVGIKLELTPLGELSSWASLLQAYERWILTDDSPIRHDLAARLMSSIPAGIDRSPAPPAPAFNIIVDLAPTELAKIGADPNPRLAVIREFWGRTLPEALHQPIGHFDMSLANLHEQMNNGPLSTA